MKRRSLLTAIIAATVLLTGCLVGPTYHRPTTPVPPTFRDVVPTATPREAAAFADLPWWEVFRDPVLQKLIRTGLEKNYDLRIAAEQIESAREIVTITHANQMPRVAGDATYSGGRAPQQPRTDYLALTGDVSYQLDIFGGLRRATEASRAQLLAAEDARRTVVMTLVSDIATDYYQLLALDLQLQLAKETIQSQAESVRLTKRRADGGTATRVEALQAQQVLDAANARIPDIERQIGRYENAISILLGNYPEGTPRGLVLTDQYLPPTVPPGLTTALIERRPDILRAEKMLIYYNAEIGVAKAALYPQIAISGSFGPSAVFTSLMNSHPPIWDFGATLAHTVFDAGARKAKVRFAESDQKQALLVYAQTIQKAFGEVADALIDYRKYHDQRTREEQSLATLQESQRTAMLRYRGGVTTYLEVLDAQRSLFNEQLTLAQVRGYEYQSVVKLYKALGGGWQQ